MSIVHIFFNGVTSHVDVILSMLTSERTADPAKHALKNIQGLPAETASKYRVAGFISWTGRSIYEFLFLIFYNI